MKCKLSSGDPKKLFSEVQALAKPRGNHFPNNYMYDSKLKLANAFAGFFKAKVDTIVSEFEPFVASNSEAILGVVSFDEFSEVPVDEVSKLCKLKTSELDPLPSIYIVLIWNSIVPAVHRLVTSSLSSEVFPSAYKQSYITPLIKSASRDSDALNSYRPVSNLPFLSKAIETDVCHQLMAHFDSHGLFHSHQSAYRPGHSVETAIQHVYSSICEQLDRGRAVFLVLLDFIGHF